MKCSRVIRKLFFINLLCVFWWPLNCDIKLNTNTQSTLDSQASTSRIENVSIEQAIGHEHSDVKKHIEETQPDVEYVNTEDIKNTGGVNIMHNVQESLHNEAAEKFTKESMPKLENSMSNSPDQESTLNHKHGDTDNKENLISEDEAAKALLEETNTHSDIDVSMPQSNSELKTVITEALPMSDSSFIETIESNQQQPQYDGMPSFDEWKKMMLAEQEKGGQKVPSPSLPGKKISSQKRKRNYSSYECGAKIVASNSEAEGKSRILNELVDEYMLNPCKAKIWFVIELCETVQASQIELANFELFSSCPKEFAVYSSDNFPTRDWVLLGTFTAAEQRVLQSFELKQEGFLKFVKIELLSYYGKEHYCPLSVVRIFGTSMVDEYEEMETLSNHHDFPDDDLDRLDIPVEDQGSTNIFGSATDAVINIVKKAAQALGQQPVEEGQNATASASDQQNMSEAKSCKFPSTMESCKGHDENQSDSTISTLPEFIAPPSSVHQSLFHLLRRCDQCISSRIGYYSAAQPHCRFLQAALGPVVFQALCDWFKEHSFDAAVAAKKPLEASSSFTISPTKSPPPQIMRIPLESDSVTIVTLNDSASLLSESDEHLAVSIDVTDVKINRTASFNRTRLEDSIQPTRTFQTSAKKINISHSESGKTPVVESSQVTQDSIVIDKSTAMPSKTEITHTAAITTANLPQTDVTATDTEDEQFSELLTDPNAIMPDDMGLNDVASVTEMPMVDNKGEQVRMDPGLIPGAGPATVAQKESVFMRMNNRIKSLEINMSLSSQYLQELSQRYRRQMEDMQRAFNRTIGTLNDTARKAAEKDAKQQEIINSLQLQVANLSGIVDLLFNERASTFQVIIMIHLCFMVIMAVIVCFYVRRVSSAHHPEVGHPEREIIRRALAAHKRRNSADSCTFPIARNIKRRSASEEKLIEGENPFAIEPSAFVENLMKVKKKNKKRNKGIQRSTSHPTVKARNGSPTSHDICHHKKQQSHSDGCMHSKPKQRTGHLCENCNNDSCTTRISEKKRINAAPLQNLTNGMVEMRSSNASLSSTQQKSGKTSQPVERKFSFKKFLRFQKRDSI